jgi:uncharacterized protein YneF (UPF0154 family)
MQSRTRWQDEAWDAMFVSREATTLVVHPSGDQQCLTFTCSSIFTPRLPLLILCSEIKLIPLVGLMSRKKLISDLQWQRGYGAFSVSQSQIALVMRYIENQTVLRLLDGSRVYLHAIIDNFSRRILAWQVNSNFDTHVTSQLIQQAATGIGIVPRVVMDSGIENVNQTVDKLINESIIRRVLAQVDVQYSNSMIEAFWRQLKNQWLYLNTLDNIGTVRRLIQFYVQQHNSVIPHSAHRGQTPDEMYFGTGQAIPEQLAKQQLDARQQRLATNRATTCAQCQSEPTLASIAKTY